MKGYFIKKRGIAIFIVFIIIANLFSPYEILLNESYAANPADSEPYFKNNLPTTNNSENTEDWDDGVASITIPYPTKTTFNHGDVFTLGNNDEGNELKIIVTKADGTIEEVPITEATIKEIVGTEEVVLNMTPNKNDYDATTNSLAKNVKITYDRRGVIAQRIYTITIMNPVDKVELTSYPKTDYKIKESTANAGGKITVKRKAGNEKIIDVEDAWIENLSTSTLTGHNGRTATIKYTEDETEYPLTYTYYVADCIKEIKITAPPTTKINYGDETALAKALAEGKIKKIYESGAEDESEAITTNMVKDALENVLNITPTKEEYISIGSNELTKEYTIKYTEDGITGQEAYTVTIVNVIDNVTFKEPPRSNYLVGADMEDIKLLVTRKAGNTEEVTITKDDIVNVRGFDTSAVTESPKEVTVTYAGEELKFNINVTEPIKKFTLHTNDITTYKYGDDLDLTGVTIDVENEDGTKEEGIEVDSSMVSGYNPTPAANTLPSLQTITVTYGLDKDGEPVTASYTVIVRDVKTKTVIKVPTKTTYYYGRALDLSTGKIVESWLSGTDDTEKAVTIDMVTDNESAVDVNSMKPTAFDINQKARKTFVITCDGVTENYIVTIVNDIKSIKLKEQPQTVYNCGDQMNNAIGSIEIQRANGSKEEIPLTDARVSFEGFDTSAEKDNIPVKVKFTENGKTRETAFTINVKEAFFNDIGITETEQVTYTTPVSVVTKTIVISQAREEIPTYKAVEEIEVQKIDNKIDTEDIKDKNNANDKDEKKDAKDEPKGKTAKDDKNNKKTNDSKRTEEEKKLEDDNISNIAKIVAGIMTFAGLLVLIVLVKDRSNIEICIVEEDGDVVIVGKDRITKKYTEIDLNDYEDEMKDYTLEIILNKHISKILDGKVVTLRADTKVQKEKVVYDDDEFIITIEKEDKS